MAENRECAAKIKRVLRYLTSEIMQLQYQQAIGVGVGTPGEYRPASYEKIVRALIGNAGLRVGDVFLDIGFGLGKAVFVASCFPFEKCLGIEIAESLPKIATNIATLMEVGRVEFQFMDATNEVPEASHVYIFSQGMSLKLIAGIANSLNKVGWKRLISSHKPKQWAQAGLEFDANSVNATVTGLSMSGSGNQYAMYVLDR
jgi:hypothetical protein